MLPFDTDLLADVPGKDAVCIAPGTTRQLKVGAPAGTLVVTWTDRGPHTQGLIAARAQLAWADGRSTERNLFVGEHVGRPPAPTRTTLPAVLGTGHDGAPVLGGTFRYVTGRPDVSLESLTIEAKARDHTLCVTGLGIEPGPAPVSLPGAYTWQLAPTLDAPLPQAVPIEAPAGTHGATRLKDGHLVFADGTRARFFGVDLYHRYAIPRKEDADALAATLARMGFNMVRLHHMELPEVGLVNPRRGQALPDGTVEPALTPAVADRLDYFLSRLKAHGVYLFLEGSTFRTYTAADGVSDPHPSIPNGHKPLPYFEDDWRRAQFAWFDTLWGRTNAYTGLRYADDPMVAIVELTNEHSLLSNWGPGLETLPTPHLARLDAAWNAWLRTRYPDDAALAAAWVGGARPGLQPGESLTTGTVRRDPSGVAVGGAFPDRRRADLYAFYAGLEHAYVDAFTAHVRALGFAQPLVPTLPYGRPDIQKAHAGAQVSDLHLEWDVPNRRDTFRGTSLLAAPREQGLLEMLALATRAGAAMTVSELNHALPNPYMAEAPLFWATLASVQDWDALVWNSFPLSADPPGEGWAYDDFDLRVATVKLAQMPTASSLFRGGWVPPAQGWFPVHYSDDAARTAASHGRLPLPVEVGRVPTWLAQRVETSVEGLPPAQVPADAAEGVGWWAETGADAGLFVVDQPMVRARIGPPTRAVRTLGDGAGARGPRGLEVDADGFSAVSLASTDGHPLGTARAALLAIGTEQVHTGFVRDWGGTLMQQWGILPAQVAPLRGVVRLAWPERPVVRPLDEKGREGAPLRVRRARGGLWEVDLTEVRTPLLSVTSPR
jgi:hypothetical protein